jgi:hypothetical protein
VILSLYSGRTSDLPFFIWRKVCARSVLAVYAVSDNGTIKPSAQGRVFRSAPPFAPGDRQSQRRRTARPTLDSQRSDSRQTVPKPALPASSHASTSSDSMG